jgi:hypothetical protein
MADRYEFTDTPDLRLSSNGRRNLHFMQEAKLVRAERNKWGWLFKATNVRLVTAFPVVLHWTLYFADRPHDAANLHSAFKPLEDALVDIGVLPGDSPVHVRRVSYGSVVDKSKAPLTVLEIEEATGHRHPVGAEARENHTEPAARPGRPL